MAAGVLHLVVASANVFAFVKFRYLAAFAQRADGGAASVSGAERLHHAGADGLCTPVHLLCERADVGPASRAGDRGILGRLLGLAGGSATLLFRVFAIRVFGGVAWLGALPSPEQGQ